MSTKVTIDKISVTIGKRTLDLTMEEARALKKALNDMIEPTITFPRTERIERIIERERPFTPPWKFPPIMWGDGGVMRHSGPTRSHVLALREARGISIG